MSLAAGARIGPYEVLGSLGAGGMGEVYRATDTRLKRSVAIKVLPASVAGDADRLARFQREAEVLAALNHPNIAAIYGFERSSDLTALVMELVDGEDLSQRIARGAIPIDEALPIAKQIAEALEAAHEQGIIHRDLKPANIKVRADGTVKILDFGLAKALDPTADSRHQTPAAAATITSPAMTQAGMILGSAAYMAPEQAKGKSVDKRADIWAFGVVLHEMLTGRRLFDAEDISETLAAVLTRDVSASSLPATVPPRLRALLRECLVRDPRQRLRDIGDARIRLEDIISGAGEGATSAAGAVTTARTPSRVRERIAWGVAAVFALLAGVAGMWALRPIATPSETRLDVTALATDAPTSFAISPDGGQLVFVGSEADGQSQLWLRSLDQTVPVALAGTEGASYPFWSPDGRSVAFIAAGSVLKRLDIGGGLPKTLAGLVTNGLGGSWSVGGDILVGQSTGSLMLVRASGGTAAAITKLTPDQISHRWPHFLPGGRRFLFYGWSGPSQGLYLGSLDSPDTKRIADADTGAQFVAPDWMLFVRQGVLTARRLDLVSGELSGEQVAVADQVVVDAAFAGGGFSVAAGGSITYRTGRALESQLIWFDRSGNAVGTIGSPDSNNRTQPMLSPDGRRVAAFRTMQSNTDLWLFDGVRETRLTFDVTRDMYPVWSPDGSRIAFSKDLKGPLSLFQKPSVTGGAEQLLRPSANGALAPNAWSPDGRFLIYLERHPVTGGDIWVLPLDGKQPPSAFVNSKFEERAAQFSPDGRWLAYCSDESGRSEVYLRPFPASSGQFQVSTMGGIAPRWRRDGKELYYIAPNGTLMAVSLTTIGGTPDVGAPVALFRPRIVYGGTNTVGILWQYDVAPDGRFLINVSTGSAVTAPITLIQNWQPATKP